MNQLLLDGKTAMARGDKRAAQILFRQVLEQDWNNRTAWEALYDLSEREKPFHIFQLDFREKYFPQKKSYQQQSRPEPFTFNKSAIYAGMFASTWTCLGIAAALAFLTGRTDYISGDYIVLPAAIAGWFGSIIADMFYKKYGNGRKALLYWLAGGGLGAMILMPTSFLVGGIIQVILN